MNSYKQIVKVKKNNIPFKEEYDVDTSMFTDVCIATLGLSISVTNSLKRANYNTVADILEVTETDLCRIKNIGKGSVKIIHEIISNLIESKKRSDIYDSKAHKQCFSLPEIICVNIDSILNESFICKTDMTEKEVSLIKRYKNAVKVMGSEISREVYINPNEFLPIIESLDCFSKEITKRNIKSEKLCKTLNNIPANRHTQKALPYLYAYTFQEAKLNTLRGIYGAGAKIKDIPYDGCLDDKDFYTLVNFLEWMSFDLEKISESFIKEIYEDDIETICNLRTEGKSIDETCQKLKIACTQLYMAENRIKGKMKILLSRYNIIKMILAMEDGMNTISGNRLAEYLGIHKEVIMFYLRKLRISQYFFYDAFYDVFSVMPDINNRLRILTEDLTIEMTKDEMNQYVYIESERLGFTKELIKRLVEKRYRCSTLSMYRFVLGDCYPTGIDVGDNHELNMFRQYLKNIFGDVKISSSNKTLSNGISKVGICCSRGRYIHEKYVNIPDDVLNEIDRYIESEKREIVRTTDLFVKFEQLLLLYTNIHNKYFLYGVLKHHLSHKYKFNRSNILK